MRLICIFLLFISSWTFANTTPIRSTDVAFDVNQANQQFDQINLKLSIEDLSLPDLSMAVSALAKLNQEAEHCVSEMERKLSDLNDFVSQEGMTNKHSDKSVDRVYLDQEKNRLVDQQAQCRLFSIRALEALNAYKTVIAKLEKQQALSRDMPLWESIQAFRSHVGDIAPDVWFKRCYDGLIALNWLQYGLFFAAMWLLSFMLLSRFQKTPYAQRWFQSKILRAHYTVLCALLFCFAGLYCYYRGPDAGQVHYLKPLFEQLFFYFFAVLIILLGFRLKYLRLYLSSHWLNYDYFRQLLIVTISLLVLGHVGALFEQAEGMGLIAWQLLQSMYLLLVLGAFLYYTRQFCLKHIRFNFIKHHAWAIRTLAVMWVCISAGLDIEGYHRLAISMNVAGLMTLAIIGLTLMLTISAQKGYLMLYEKPYLNQHMLYYFGYKKDHVFMEFWILKCLLQFLIIVTAIYCIGQSIDYVSYYVEMVYSDILDGIHFDAVIVYPVRIMSGVLAFCMMFLLFRAVSASIIRQHQAEEEEEAQVAIASLVTYIGFSIAIIVGLVIAGFNFTGLAIVAGALSVGIGLGLQSIVNNFVSGLILLIEKPIRPGDRINVDGAEGYVKKIRVRSTQIITPNREDIIIPNSDLITRRVTNYMFSDKYCRIRCEVGVAYGSDTVLVRDTLLAVANHHEDVVRIGHSKPTVLFKAFGDSNLIFEVLCLIRDVNKRNIVKSDLNFAIEEAFRTHHIQMSAPVRELHVNWPENNPPLST